MRRLITISVLASLAGLGGAAPVAASGPEIAFIVIQETDEHACGGYSVIQEFTASIREKLFLDPDGHPTHVIANIHWEATLTNSTTGFEVRDNAAWTTTIDFTTGQERQVGLIWSLNIPGEGIVVLDAGVIALETDGSLVVHGPHQVADEGIAVVCAALG